MVRPAEMKSQSVFIEVPLTNGRVGCSDLIGGLGKDWTVANMSSNSEHVSGCKGKSALVGQPRDDARRVDWRVVNLAINSVDRIPK